MQLAAVGAAVGRGSVSLRRRFNTHRVSSLGGLLHHNPKIVVVLDGPPRSTCDRPPRVPAAADIAQRVTGAIGLKAAAAGRALLATCAGWRLFESEVQAAAGQLRPRNFCSARHTRKQRVTPVLKLGPGLQWLDWTLPMLFLLGWQYTEHLLPAAPSSL